MANDTRSSQKIKDSENNNSKGRQINGRGSTSSHAASSDPSGLRRSTRETSSKHKTTPSSLSARKSEFVEKQNPTTSLVRKSERIEKQKNPSPLRRSHRVKMLSSTFASGSKKSYNISDLSNMKRMTEKKEKKEKSVKQLTLETEDVDENENPDEEPVKVNKTQMDAHHYKELFKKQKQKANTADHCEEPKKQGDSGSKQVDDGIKLIERNGRDLEEDFTEKSVIQEPESNINQSPRKTLEDSDGHELSSTSLKHRDTWESPKKNLENSDGHELPMTGLKHGHMGEACTSLDGDGLHLLKNDVVAKETREDAGKVVLENIQIPTSADSTLKGRILGCDTSLEMGHMLSKRKRDTADIVFDPPLMVGSKVMCNSMADAVTLLPSNCKSKDYVEISNTCFKKQRMEVDPLVQENCSSNTKSNCLFDSAAEERLAKDIANESKSESSRFIEYWVPVQISSAQLEQYCATLLENSLSLCSPLRSDPIGALRNTLISIRKCCDHPYLVDHSLQMLLTKDLKPIEYLDVGIKASGKLQLLETMLLEMKKLGLRAVILFQSIGGSGRDAIGDILDDFLRQRFGQDSFERIDSGLVYSKKQSALNKFNKENDRFVFLLETRACQPSIKLSSVDIVIMFNSDWNPMNDLKALQRIALGSKFKQIMIFRLYSSLTVEEKFLILAKQGKTFDGNAPSISPTTIQRVLMWGASHIFNKLNEFHNATPAFDGTIVFDQSHLEDVLQEFLIILAQNREDYDSRRLSLILQAKPQVTYRTDLPLFGEQTIQVMNEDQPCMFWTTLLNGKHPAWKYSSSSSQRNRKRTSVHHFDDIQKKPEAGSGEVVKKRKKVGSDFVDSPSLKSGSDTQMADQDKEGISGTPSPNLSHSLGRSTGLVNDQIYVHHGSSSPHLSTSPFSKIPKVNMIEHEGRRKLPDSQKSLHALLKPDIAKLSEVLHLPDNVRVMVESFLEYIMNNHQANRELATRPQAFQISLCWTAAALLNHKINHKKSLELANKSINFGCKKEEADYVYSLLRCLKRTFLYRTGKMKVPNPPKASDLSTKCIGTEHFSAASDHEEVKVGLDGSLKVSESSEKQSLSQSELALEYQLALSDLLKSLKEIQRKCDKMMKNLLQKQREEKENFDRTYEKEMVELENKRKMEAAVIRLHSTETTRSDKLKKLDDEYAMKIDELKKQMTICLKSLEVEHEESRNKVRQWKVWWVEAVKSWARNELGLTECERAISSGHEQEHFVPKVPISKEQIPVGGMADGELGQDIPASLGDCLDNALFVKHLQQDQICDRSVLNVPDANRVPETVISGDGTEKIDSAKSSSSGEKVPDGITLRTDDSEVSLGASEAVRETAVHKNIIFVTSPLSKCLNPNGATSNVPCREASPTTPEIVSFDSLQNILPSNLHSLKEQFSDISLPCIPEVVPLAETETAPGDVAKGDNHPMRHSLSMPDGDSPASTPEILNSSDTLDKVVPDIAASCIPNGKIPSSKSPFAPRQVHENDDTNGENDGVADKLSIRNSFREDEVSTPEVATSCMSDRDVPLADPKSANREVLEGRNADRSNNVAFREVSTPEVPDGEDPASTSDIVNSSDRVASCIPNGKVPSSESPFAPREAHESDDDNGENDGVGDNLPIRNSLSMPGGEDEISTPEVAASCMSDKDFPLSDPESANREVPEGGNTERENNAATGVDRQDGMVCSVNQEPQFLEASLIDSSQAQHVPALAQGGPLLSNQVEPGRCTVSSTDSEMQARDAANIQTQSNSQVVELSPLHSALDSTHSQNGVAACITELAQVQPSSSRGSPSNLNSQLDLPLAGGVELQPSNEGHLSHASRHVSDTRTVSTNLPLQTAPAGSSHMPFSSHDPLQNEMERIVKEAEQTIKIHEEMKLQLKSDCNKEIEETIAQIRKKYEIKLQEAEALFLLKKKELDVNHNKVLMNKILAEAFRLKIIDNNFTGMLQETGTNFMQQLAQLSPQQMPQRPCPVPGGTPPATISTVLSVQTASPPVVTPQAISPSLQAVNTPSTIFSGTTPRPPSHISSITPSLGNLQVGSEIRAPAPHLHPFRPSTSMHPGVLLPLSHGMPIQLGHGNAFTPRIAPTVSQAGRAHIPATSVGLPVLPNLSAFDLLINAANQSMANPNPPNTLPSDTGLNRATSVQPLLTMPTTQSNAPQPSAATDIVCLSDDD